MSSPSPRPRYVPPENERYDPAEDGVRLARLKNKCSADEDLEYYVREAADIVGLIGEGGERGGASGGGTSTTAAKAIPRPF